MPRTRRKAAAAANEKIKHLTGPEAVESKDLKDEIVIRTPGHKKKASLLLPPPPTAEDVRKFSRSNSPKPVDDSICEEIDTPPCQLPLSSNDLLLDDKFVLSALSVHEFLRVFGRVLRLAPFRFEDLCASLVVDERCCLSAEVHISLLRCLLAEDDLCSVEYAPSEEHDSVNVHWAVIDAMTWPACLLTYLRADPDFMKKHPSLGDKRSSWQNYPIVSPRYRVDVLSFLCARASETALIHQCVNVDMQFESEDYCRWCGRLGDMVCCDRCPAVYHLHCLKPPLASVPEGDWTCPTCVAIGTSGVVSSAGGGSDAVVLTALRHSPIVVDKWGRRYWHLARRVFVETRGGDLVAYYSAESHFQELMTSLRDSGDNTTVEQLEELSETIVVGMQQTQLWIEAARLLPVSNRIRVPPKNAPSPTTSSITPPASGNHPSSLVASATASSTTTATAASVAAPAVASTCTVSAAATATSSVAAASCTTASNATTATTT
eukprot:scpid75106/ scgid13174/ Nucleosome-remodeling factor subunit BPTF; Bromodomain and PHD finger-containing transcription factor; Fetal Alz-50 clone 1 protein; Fetal Alzheimer antigen